MQGTTFYFGWEVKFMECLQSFAGPVVESLAELFTLFGETGVMIVLLFGIYWGYDKEWGKYIGTNIVIALTVAPFIKNIVVRRRPYFDNPGIKCLRLVDKKADLYDISVQGFSMPSMHASNTATIFFSLADCIKKKAWWIVSGVLVFLIGLSRVILGVHYPTDVIAGWILGTLILAGMTAANKRLKGNKKYIVPSIILLLTLPGWFFCKSEDFYTTYGIMAGVMLGIFIEEKRVNFENTRNILCVVIRLAGGCGIYFVLNTLMKLPFSSEFLNCGSFLSHLVRAVRYFVIAVVGVAVYPMIFRYIDKINFAKRRFDVEKNKNI